MFDNFLLLFLFYLPSATLDLIFFFFCFLLMLTAASRPPHLTCSSSSDLMFCLLPASTLYLLNPREMRQGQRKVTSRRNLPNVSVVRGLCDVRLTGMKRSPLPRASVVSVRLTVSQYCRFATYYEMPSLMALSVCDSPCPVLSADCGERVRLTARVYAVTVYTHWIIRRRCRLDELLLAYV